MVYDLRIHGGRGGGAFVGVEGRVCDDPEPSVEPRVQFGGAHGVPPRFGSMGAYFTPLTYRYRMFSSHWLVLRPAGATELDTRRSPSSGGTSIDSL